MMPMQTHSPRARQRGMTLVELMVALLLSLVLLAGVVQVYLGSKASYRLGDAMTRVQENGRFALDFIGRDTRMAGFTGCRGMASGLQFTNQVDIADLSADFGTAHGAALQNGIDALDGYSVDAALNAGDKLYDLGLRTGGAVGNVVLGTDALIIMWAGSCPGGYVKQVMPSTAANIKIENATTCGIQQEDIVVVTDCKKADMFRVTNDPQSPGGFKDTLTHSNGGGNLQNTLSKQYGLDAFVYKVNMSIFYIGNGTSGDPALFRRRLVTGGFVNEELVENVEDMAVLYGEDTDVNDKSRIPNRYRKAPNVTDFEDVTTVRPMLLLRTLEDNVATQALNYFYDGADNAGPDRRVRRVFSSTVNVRNRTL